MFIRHPSISRVTASETFEDNAREAFLCALELVNTAYLNCPVNIRVGCAMGTIFTGILSQFKFCFDIYGASVNFAEYLSSVGDYS